MLRRFFASADSANLRIGLMVTNAVGTMWMAYAFALLALAGLPQALRPGGPGIVQWFAQTFLQLVLLSVIIVGQNVQAAQEHERARVEREHREVQLRNDADMMRAIVATMERMDNRTERIETMVDALDGEIGVQGEEG